LVEGLSTEPQFKTFEYYHFADYLVGLGCIILVNFTPKEGNNTAKDKKNI
jgi:hypothetical protein